MPLGRRFSPLALSLLIGGGSCVKGPATIKIAVAGPLSGDQAKMGGDLLHGVEMAVAEWNERGGIGGEKIEILAQDDRHDPREAVSVANKIVNLGAVAAVGHFNSSCSIPASRVYADGGVVMITPASTNPQLTRQGLPGIFRICGTDDQQGRVEAEYVTEVLKKKRVAILHDKTTYGQGLADYFRKNLGDRAEVVFYEGITQGDKDFTGVLTRLRDARPEAVMFGGIYPEAGLLVKQMKALGLDVPFVSGDGTIDQEFIRIGGPAAEGAYLSFGPLGPSGEAARDLPGAGPFVERYRKRYGDVGPYSIYAYDAAQVVLKSLAQGGKTDGKGLSERIHQSAFDGALGRIEFDEHGDVRVAPYVMWTVSQGRFVPAPAAPPR